MLTFQELRRANVKRCTHDFKQPLNLWDALQWGGATAGEVGEACNIAKKIIRVDDGLVKAAGWKQTSSREALVVQLANEIADMIIYADLWAASENIDLGEAVKRVFNEKSHSMCVGTYIGGDS